MSAAVTAERFGGEVDYHQCFAPSYARARSKFVAAAGEAGAALAAYVHPSERGPGGEELAIDVAHFGDRGAGKQLLVVIGTHGQEGFAGSAIAIGWMQAGGPKRLPPGLGVLMVHGLNPYGFAYGSRTTEHNVDLNRNFVDHRRKDYPANPGYAELHPYLIPAEWTQDADDRADETFRQFAAKNGPDALYNALMSGQYTHPDGLIYGGDGREWSNVTLETIIRDHLASAEKVGYIDWHTGIGEYGKPFFLCFNDPASGLVDLSAAWWGEEAIKRARPHGLAVPNYSGLVFGGVTEFLGNRPICGAVIEIGTRGQRMRQALRLDLWLRFKGDPKNELYGMLRADMDDAFCPFNRDWRRSAVENGVRITEEAVAGMRNW
jgi:hypothetical protein